MNYSIEENHNNLRRHPMYDQLNSLENVRTFMKYHVFAVWDFMSLLKSLQKEITCLSIPWVNSQYNPQTVRLINEIVIGEESDLDQNGEACSHFSLYLKAMQEIGADTSLINNFLQEFNLELLPIELQRFVAYHLDLALNGQVHEVAASFFYGREKLIPDMFRSVVQVLDDNKMDCPTLIYYLERHIEVDGEDHGPKALMCLDELTQNRHLKEEASQVAIKSLQMRSSLWSFIQQQFE